MDQPARSPPPDRSTPTAILEALADHFGVALHPALPAFCDVFAPSLRHFAEFGVRWPRRAVGVLTQGYGARFARDLVAFAAAHGFDERHLCHLLELQRAVDPWVLVRLAGGPDGLLLGVYFRRPLALTDALGLLADLGVAKPVRRHVEALGAILEAHRTSFLGVRFHPEPPPTYRLHLHTYGDEQGELADRLFDALQFFGIGNPGPTFVEHMHGKLGEGLQDVFVSPVVGDGYGLEALELQYFQVPLRSMEATLRTCELMPSDASLEATARALGLAHAENVGVHLGAPEPGWMALLNPRDPRRRLAESA